MKNFVQVIKECESASGAGKKAAIEAALSQANPTAQRLIKEALDPYRVFGVRKYDQPTQNAADGDENFESNVLIFFKLLDDLASRALTGNDAREAVSQTLGLFTAEEASYLARVFDKDLKAGFSADTFNKIHKNNKIPTFEVMLADKCESVEEFEQKVTFPCQADWKYDGQRTICIVRAGQPVEYRARSGKPMDHLVGTYDADLEAIRAAIGYDFVLDGESFASDFIETINAKKEGNQAAKDALRLRAFFMMPLTDWMNQTTLITMRANRQALDELFAKVQPKRIELSAGRQVTDYADMVAYCNEVIDVHKQEGLILKNWDAVYIWGRDYAWTKVKRFYDVDARVVAWYKGRKKSRLENTVGGLTVEGRDEHGRPFRTNVGSGFSDADRDHILKNWHLYEGSTAVITYQEMSLAKGETIYSLRFPTIKQLLRDDKTVQPLEDTE